MITSLTDFETYHTISNVNSFNNKFYFGNDDVEITIPGGSYQMQAIDEFLKRASLRKRRVLRSIDVVKHDSDVSWEKDAALGDDDEDGEYPITLRVNYNM